MRIELPQAIPGCSFVCGGMHIFLHLSAYDWHKLFLFVYIFIENKFTIACKESDTVTDLKRKIQSEEAMPIDHLIYDRKSLKNKDHRKIVDCDIQKGDIVYLVVKPRMEEMERCKRKAAMRRESHGLVNALGAK